MWHWGSPFGSQRGLGVQPEGCPVSYFGKRYFSIEGPAILDALEDAGFKVSWEERSFGDLPNEQ
jgi:hypothetical protein